MQMLRYFIARFAEASTYAAIAGFLAFLHVNLDPGLWQHIVDCGLAAAGLLGVLVPDRTTP